MKIMFNLFVASCLSASVLGQSFDAKNAKILKEQRFDAGDGRFGAAFAQEDGTVFREETTSDGERIGQYSYIDQDGKTITVRYSAGKDGFRILEGSHIPEGATGLQSAPFDPEIAAAEELPEQQSAPVRQQAAPVRQQAAPVRQQAAPVRQQAAPVRQQAAPVRQQAAPVRQQPVQQFRPQSSGDFNPFINPADSSHLNFQLNKNAAQFQSQGQSAPRQQVVQQQPRQQFVEQPRQQFSAQPRQQQQFSPQPRQQQQFSQQPRQQQQFSPQPRQQQQFSPQPRQQQQVVPNPNSVPACANCEGVNPFINPADSSHSQLFTSQQQQPLQPAFATQQQSARQPASTFIPQQQQPAQQPLPNPSFSFQQRTQTQQQPIQPAFSSPTFRQPQQQPPTFRQPQQQPSSFRQPQEQSPTTLNNFQGNLNLNRFDTGFNFDFSS